MRHQVAGKHLGRTASHRLTLRRNLAASLFEHGTISTTLEKAKFVRPFAEKLITLARDGSLHARRRAISLLQDRNICTEESGETVKVTTVITKLFEEIGPQFVDRNGGYTRIIRLPLRRIGDNGQLAMLQLVGELGGGIEAEIQKPAKKTDVTSFAVDAVTDTTEEDHQEAGAEQAQAASPETGVEETPAEAEAEIDETAAEEEKTDTEAEEEKKE